MTHAPSDLRARDIMTSEVITLEAELNLREAVDRLIGNEISGAPVVNEGGRLVGVVTLSDVARHAADGSAVRIGRGNPEFFVRGWEDRYATEELSDMQIERTDLSVSDVMTRELYTVDEETPLSEAAGVMVRGHVHRVLVTRQGELSGIVSSLDLLGAFVGVDRHRPA